MVTVDSSSTLKQAIEALYNTFASYPLNPEMDSCPCCVNDDEKAALTARPLRELGEELHHYAWSAISTWGDENDLRHFLPRLFELVASEDLMVDTFVVMNKLELGNWKSWPEVEQQAICDFLLAWWIDAAHLRSSHLDTLLCEIGPRLGLQPMLDTWLLKTSNESLNNFNTLILYELDNIYWGKSDWKSMPEADRELILQHLINQKPLLEALFFEVDDQHPELGQQISQSLSQLDYARKHWI